MSDESIPFGGQVFDELRRLTGDNVVGTRFDYAEIQELKAADRAGTARLLEQGGSKLTDVIETGEPAEVAQFLILEAEESSEKVQKTSLAQTVFEFLTSILTFA